MIKHFLSTIGVACLAFIALPAPAAHAITAGAIPTGVTVSPVIQQLHLQPAQTTASFTVLVTNNTKHPVNVELTSANFVANGQTGGLTFLTHASSDPNILGHVLASGITEIPDHLDLAPKATQKVTVTLSNADKLAPGGHYGAVLYHVVNNDVLSNGGGNRVSLQQALSTLIFATTAGQGTQGLKLLRPNLRGFTFHFPQSLNVIFEATGNTQVTPRGTVSIGTGDVKKVPISIINVNSGMLLPGSTRLFNTPLPTTIIGWWPGVYHIHFDYHYDGQTRHQTYDTSFLYINVWHILLTILIIAFILWGLIKLKRYYRYLQRYGKLEKVKKLRTSVVKRLTPKPKIKDNFSKSIAVLAPIGDVHNLDVKITTKAPTKPKPKSSVKRAKATKSAKKIMVVEKTSTDLAEAIVQPTNSSKK